MLPKKAANVKPKKAPVKRLAVRLRGRMNAAQKEISNTIIILAEAAAKRLKWEMQNKKISKDELKREKAFAGRRIAFLNRLLENPGLLNNKKTLKQAKELGFPIIIGALRERVKKLV